ncbi:hypothetical protein EYF80_051413 [Liparis tanakae]|uniref:Uncharacterized protein n=1 Tax=Liparis tanakae TaxID=230148 RepID=A0A4Z2FBB2_9TELE|nr:hypothetical protein EYF80_051413 [Liparis tanakae]
MNSAGCVEVRGPQLVTRGDAAGCLGVSRSLLLLDNNDSTGRTNAASAPYRQNMITAPQLLQRTPSSRSKQRSDNGSRAVRRVAGRVLNVWHVCVL